MDYFLLIFKVSIHILWIILNYFNFESLIKDNYNIE